MEPISKQKFKILGEKVRKLNSENSWELEGLKLWHRQKTGEKGRAWGFIKIRSQEEADQAIECLQKISSVVPELPWRIHDEGKVRSKNLRVENGRITGLR